VSSTTSSPSRCSGSPSKAAVASAGLSPEVLALLGEDRIDAFTGLQAHQQHPWHAFLVQLAAVALHAAGEERLREKASAWSEMLRALTRGRPEPWSLVVGDLGRPAFMQPPVPEETLDDFQKPITCPDELDVLVTSKNHDVKSARAGRPEPDHWVYALVSLQTMEGYSGRNYGVSRMNGGAGSRPGVGLAPDLGLGSRFRRDVKIALEHRAALVRDFEYARKKGHALLWTVPWDGVEGLTLAELDPLFIEVCRRVRLVCGADGAVQARNCPTAATRVVAGELRGNTGDLWTPVQKAEAKAFTATEAGFSYRVLHRLLGDEFAPGAAQIPQRGEGAGLLVASVLARGMGTTSGYHERRVPVPGDVIGWIRDPDRRTRLGQLAGERVKIVSDLQNRVLRPALLRFLQGDPREINFKDRRADPWVAAHDADVDAEFFPKLWGDLERPAEEARREWALRVIELGRARLRDAFQSAPVANSRRYRAIARAEGAFEGAARTKLPFAYLSKEETDVVRS
jgi:CRISPR system Cascade subunit CasA